MNLSTLVQSFARMEVWKVSWKSCADGQCLTDCTRQYNHIFQWDFGVEWMINVKNPNGGMNYTRNSSGVKNTLDDEGNESK